MNHRQRIAEVAEANGWAVHTQPNPDRIGITELRRRNPSDRRCTEYVMVDCGVLDQVISASWGPNLAGVGGRSIGNQNRNKLDWVLRRLRSE